MVDIACRLHKVQSKAPGRDAKRTLRSVHAGAVSRIFDSKSYVAS